MTKNELKNLIKESLSEYKKTTNADMGLPNNIVAKTLYNAMKGNPGYSEVTVNYFDKYADSPHAYVSGYFGEGFVFIAITSETVINAQISKGEDRVSRDLTSVESALKLIRNPMSVYGASKTSSLIGGTVVKVFEKGDWGMTVAIKTTSGKIVKGSFSVVTVG